jgi:pyruvate,water dikinase
VVPLDTAPVDAALLGGKGAALAELVAFGHPVPSGFVVTVPAYLALLELGGVGDAHTELGAAFRSGQTRLDLAERIASAIDRSPFPPGLAEQIAEQIAVLRLWDHSDGLIVRSSATVEDSKSSSFAGIFESVAIGDPASSRMRSAPCGAPPCRPEPSPTRSKPEPTPLR